MVAEAASVAGDRRRLMTDENVINEVDERDVRCDVEREYKPASY
jgi:hypothetical protein